MWKTYKILFLLIITEIIADLESSYSREDYCKLPSCPMHRHVACFYIPGQLGDGCTLKYNVSSHKVGPGAKTAILHYHNVVRQYLAMGLNWKGLDKAQSAPAFMPNLTWDEELAFLAQIWADQCPSTLTPNDFCRNVERFQVNQLVARFTADSLDNLPKINSILDKWYDEVKFFDNRKICSYVEDKNTTHYTQMVWANTTKIGCGQNIFYTNDLWVPSEERYIMVLVCNYGPGGNMPNEKIYEPKYTPSVSSNLQC